MPEVLLVIFIAIGGVLFSAVVWTLIALAFLAIVIAPVALTIRLVCWALGGPSRRG